MTGQGHDSIVKPVLLYGSDVCGYRISKCRNMYNELKKDIFEKCHLGFLRFVLGVNKRAPIIGLYGETGRFPLYISSIVSYLKYWHRLVNLADQNVLLNDAVSENVKIRGTWIKGIDKLLKVIDISPQNAKKVKCATLVRMITSKCKLIFENGWKDELFNDIRKRQGGNKLRLYRKYKSNFCTEPYLFHCNHKQRRTLARIRLSCHKLEIEIQRYNHTYIEPENRICKQCNLLKCEDEIHFIIECPKYKIERENFFNNIKNSNLDKLNNEQKFLYIMSNPNPDFITILAQFISKCLSIREYNVT